MDDCTTPARTRGWCDKHYRAWRIYGDPTGRYQRPACAVEGCLEPHQAKGYCRIHYARWKYNGDPGPAGRLNFPLPDQCAVESCTGVPLAKGLCATHRARFLKHGDVNAGAFRPRGTCEIPGCDQPHAARGYCDRHYARWWRTGDPERELKPLPLDEQGYVGLHRRLRVIRGPAADNACHQCGDPARQWAYDHTDLAERTDPDLGLPYSTDLSRYLPMCIRCHLAFDRRAARAAQRRTDLEGG